MKHCVKNYSLHFACNFIYFQEFSLICFVGAVAVAKNYAHSVRLGSLRACGN